MQSWGIRPISLVGLWHVERGVGYLKSWENCMSTMTRSGPPVAMPTAVSSSCNQANFSAVTKPGSTSPWLTYCSIENIEREIFDRDSLLKSLAQFIRQKYRSVKGPHANFEPISLPLPHVTRRLASYRGAIGLTDITSFYRSSKRTNERRWQINGRNASLHARKATGEKVYSPADGPRP